MRFYDAVCGNKLYAGRRRFITQYVRRFPVPDPSSPIAKDIIKKAKRLCAQAGTSEKARTLITELDELIWNAFGLIKEVAR
ncbi:MAG: hypothetical protein DMG97_42490 [Acidobacteria bacterium]|nr:MAG: hypothetical protein DMG97_42490 [Acidobacteriota bacterium]